MNETSIRKKGRRTRIRIGFVFAILGLLVLILGLNPALFGLDRSPVFGFVQIAVFLIGLSMICVGGYITLNALWNGTEKSIAADIGFRLVCTGFVICVASGMADVFGLGHQLFPQIPYFGPFQAAGVMVGEVIIGLGFLLLIPFPPRKQKQKPDDEQ
jgi:hypothetical protein